jgi:hypothetical protein
MGKVKLFIFFVYLWNSITNLSEKMNEPQLRGLLDTMTIPQLHAIHTEVNHFIEDLLHAAGEPYVEPEIHQHDKVIAEIHVEHVDRHGDHVEHHMSEEAIAIEKEKCIEAIIAKANANPSIYSIRNFGFILGDISEVFEEDEAFTPE